MIREIVSKFEIVIFNLKDQEERYALLTRNQSKESPRSTNVFIVCITCPAGKDNPHRIMIIKYNTFQQTEFKLCTAYHNGHWTLVCYRIGQRVHVLLSPSSPSRRATHRGRLKMTECQRSGWRGKHLFSYTLHHKFNTGNKKRKLT